MIKPVIGKCLLRSILYEKRMSQVDLAIKTGINDTLINKYVNDKKKMSLENAYLIADTLGCRIEDLYSWMK